MKMSELIEHQLRSLDVLKTQTITLIFLDRDSSLYSDNESAGL